METAEPGLFSVGHRTPIVSPPSSSIVNNFSRVMPSVVPIISLVIINTPVDELARQVLRILL